MSRLKIIFSVLFLLVTPGRAQYLSQSAAEARLRDAGITVSSTGNCSNRQNRSCTSLDQIREHTINQVLVFKRASNCPIIATGGTETGHSSRGLKTHQNGYKIDLRLNSCLNSYITNNFRYTGVRSDGARMYQSAAGNIYALEGNHWDIVYV